MFYLYILLDSSCSVLLKFLHADGIPGIDNGIAWHLWCKSLGSLWNLEADTFLACGAYIKNTLELFCLAVNIL